MKLILSILVNLLTVVIFAQSSGQFMQGNNLYMIRPNGDTILINAGSTTLPSTTLATVNAIASYNNPTTSTIFVKDTVRGGNFFLYTGTDAADNGMIFTDANGNKWKRQTTDGKINVRWYGAGGEATSLQNWTAITAAKNYIITHRQSAETIFFPAGTYDILYTLLFTESIKIEGVGAMTTPQSKLKFPFNATGIAIHEFNTDFVCELRNLSVENTFSVAAIDSSKPLIDIRCKVLMDNVYVPYASGVGINLEACGGGDSTNNPIFGNTDFSVLTNCKVNFALHGFRTSGCDANYITFHNCDAMQNKRWGILDNGFLGNNFYSNSFAANSNASISGTATTVSYGGNYYTATFLHDDGSGINKQPDLFPLYWTPVGAQAATPWDNAKHYWSGGAFASTHASGTSQWYSPYVEGDQPEPQLNTRSMIIGGVRGAGTGFGQIYRDQGVLNLNGKTNITGNLGLNVANNANIIYPLTMESTVNGTLAMFKTSGTAATIALQAASGSNAYLWSQGGNLYYGVNGVQLQLNSTVFKDYAGNGVVDFGSAANQWKDVYAKRFFRDGVELTGGGGISQTTLNDSTAALRVALQPAGNYASGVTNTGDNATNTQYSGLAASKQNTLVSGTNIKTINGNTILGSGDLVVSGGAGLGYTLSFQALTSSPADAATIYFGQLPKAPTTSANISKIYIRKAGTIKAANIYSYAGTAGTAEAWVANIRLNNTTDTQIASVSAATNERVWSNTSLNIAVNVGDYIEIKMVNPTWATNPLTFIPAGYIYIE